MHTLWLLQMSAPPCSRASDRAFAWMRAKRKRSACCWFDQQGMYCASPTIKHTHRVSHCMALHM